LSSNNFGGSSYECVFLNYFDAGSEPAATTAIAGKRSNFFVTDQPTNRSLRIIRRHYIDAMSVDVDDDDQNC
jgi:hypothetical protein